MPMVSSCPPRQWFTVTTSMTHGRSAYFGTYNLITFGIRDGIDSCCKRSSCTFPEHRRQEIPSTQLTLEGDAADGSIGCRGICRVNSTNWHYRIHHCVRWKSPTLF